MDLCLSNGSYLPAASGVQTLSGQQELLQRALMKLQAPRGSFPPLPNYGSRLCLLHREKPSARNSAALLFAAEALSDEPGISVQSAEVSLSPEGALLVTLQLSLSDQLTTLQLEV